MKKLKHLNLIFNFFTNLIKTVDGCVVKLRGAVTDKSGCVIGQMADGINLLIRQCQLTIYIVFR